jgi:hypothetical protein
MEREKGANNRGTIEEQSSNNRATIEQQSSNNREPHGGNAGVTRHARALRTQTQQSLDPHQEGLVASGR